MNPVIIGAAAMVFAVNILTSVLKRWIEPKFGDLGVQVTAFILAAIGALYATYRGYVPGLAEFVESTLAIFSLAVTFYEVILSKIPIFKGKETV